MSEVLIGLVSIIPLYLLLPLLKQIGFPGQQGQQLAGLDVPLSTRASEATLSAINNKIDVPLSTRASEESLAAILKMLDVALSTRASELTLDMIKTQTELVNKKLDAQLSSRASEDTLAALNSYLVYRLDVNLSTRASENTLLKFRPLFKGGIFNEFRNAGQNIFASDITPTNPPCLFKIYFSAADSAKLRVKRTKAGVSITEDLYEGRSLTAGASYIFNIMVDEGESINLTYGIGTTIQKCSVWEIQMLTS